MQRTFKGQIVVFIDDENRSNHGYNVRSMSPIYWTYTRHIRDITSANCLFKKDKQRTYKGHTRDIQETYKRLTRDIQ